MNITSGQLAQLMGNTLPQTEYDRLLPHFLHAASVANINTPQRMAMWIAQLRHESGGLRWMQEIASGADYEWRADLGNNQPGDGVRYKGRGPIQLTGRANYRAFTKWANSSGVSSLNFEAEPKLLEDPRWGFIAASYYWVVARPLLNEYADSGDVVAATRAINGGTNGLAERQAYYNQALALLKKGVKPVEKVLPFSRSEISQDTYYNCGPAASQTVIKSATGATYRETELGAALRTHQGGTDYIGQFPAVLNKYIPGAQYRHRDMPNDPPSYIQKEQLWKDIVQSVNAGHGVVANIVAPPSNYPRAVAPSTIHPAYAGGTVYHYIAIMGYAEDQNGRRLWVADSGFSPFVYWLSFNQLATLIPPKGYAYSTTAVSKSAVNQPEGVLGMSRKVPSRIVVEKEFDPEDAVANVDMNAFFNAALLVAICKKLGLDPEAIKEAAKQHEIELYKARKAKEGNK